MTKPLTYLSLKAVFQYMDGNKRLELNFHCPALRSAESSVPLNLRSLILEKEKIVVNDVCYKVKSKYQRIKTVLDGRKHVRVEILKLHDLGVIPECLKISTRNLDSGNLDFEEVLPSINRSSFPLKELRVNVAKTQNFERYLGCSQILVPFVTDYDREKELIRRILFDRKSPYIVLERIGLTSDTTIALIQNWRNNQKEIGTVLTRQNGFRILPIFSPYVDELMDVLNGRIVFLNESVLQNNMDRRCLSFPFNKTSELVLYSIRDGPNEERRTKLEVMPIGSTGPGTLTDFFIELLILLCSFMLIMLIVLSLTAVAMDSIGKTTLAYFR
ncbi:hypothetical protein CRE_09608 [Caenorhabditis remanei]|uniref:DUF38 domain-containing protein n=1 Tax=Caenorhabditis remanei TaxID=31234 RepID=E3MJ95_CAERE|nr:hypothetical protein CRE_09608 [Caenorhabditis remanei]